MSFVKKLALACLLAVTLGAAAHAQMVNAKMTDPRPADRVALAQAGLKQDAVCTRCHDENDPATILTLYQTKHGVRGDGRAPTCQDCHGDSSTHMKGSSDVTGRAPTDFPYIKGAADGRPGDDQCMTCHRGNKLNHWDGNLHQSAGVTCADCHSVHRPVDKIMGRATQVEVCANCHRERLADMNKISTHPLKEGKVVCTDCHNPHGSGGPSLLKKATVLETCFTCHAEKRGPFLFEHQPMTENCGVCHNPHGSNIASLLKSRAPFLCQECHDGSHMSGSPVGPNAAGRPVFTGSLSSGATGRSCMNCHSQVHGSNSPAGGQLLR